MASQRQIQDQGESTQEDSLGIEAAQQVTVKLQPKRATKSPKLANPAPPNDLETTQKLEFLVQSLKSKSSTIDPNTALKMIDELSGLVQKANQPEAKKIATELKQLQKLFQRKEPTGTELGELIAHLGEQTTEIATQSESGLKTLFQHLGKQLIKFGLSLSKSADLEQLERFDTIIDILEPKPKQTDLKHALTTIDLWSEILYKSEDKSLKAISAKLKSLSGAEKYFC
jgi:hypothetical protein